MRKKTVSLVLGSGGARGLAHIGIIHWLEENGYDIRSVSGCSMGALVGGIYATGGLDEFEEWVRAVTRSDMLKLLDFSLGKDGLFKGDRIMDTLRSLVGERNIEDLDIAFTAVATNLSRSREVWFNEGPVFDAIRASISMPVFFTPFRYNGEDLVDGGILNPLPIAPTFSDQTDVTIAVNLNGPPRPDVQKLAAEPSGDETPLGKAVSDFVGRVKSSFKPGESTWGVYDVVYQSFETMQGAIARQKLAAYPPDFVLEMPKNVCVTLDYHKAGPLIRYGYELAARKLPTALDAD